MRTVTEHRAHVLSLVAPLAPVAVPIAAARGLRLAAPVRAAVDLPGFDNSAMDGYAVRSSDVLGASARTPVVLPVAGDIAAGDTRRHVLPPGATLRIMTGAPMPQGADAIVPVEESDGGTDQVVLTLAAEVGRHVRPQGEDVRIGDELLPAGLVVTPGRLALAAAANVPVLQCIPRPRVAVLSTGDELVEVGQPTAYGQIVNSIGAMLAALVEAAGGELVSVSHVPDDPELMRSALVDQPGDPDLILTTGGVSMGAYDTVKEVLTSVGGVDFVKVAMRPGMPQGSGVVGARRTPIITLPGNPVSSFVSFHVFVWPVLRRLAGEDVPADLLQEVAVIQAVAADGWSAAAGKVELTRVRRDPDGVRPSGGQGSHMLRALAEGDALAVIPGEVDWIEPGDLVHCLPLVGHS